MLICVSEACHHWFIIGSYQPVTCSVHSHWLTQCPYLNHLRTKFRKLRLFFRFPCGKYNGRQLWWLTPHLAHWGRDKMAAIFQTTFPNAFSSIKTYEFCLRIHWGLFLRVRIINILALVQIMAWRRPGDKPLSEPMMFSLLTHICITRPQWVNNSALDKNRRMVTIKFSKSNWFFSWNKRKFRILHAYVRVLCYQINKCIDTYMMYCQQFVDCGTGKAGKGKKKRTAKIIYPNYLSWIVDRSFLFVAVPVCGRCGFLPFWCVVFWSVAVPISGFSLWPLRFLAVSVLAVWVVVFWTKKAYAYLLWTCFNFRFI